MKIKQKSDNDSDIDRDLTTANNLFAHFVKEISVTRWKRDKRENDKQLIPTFPPYEIYQFSDSMLKHLPKNALKKMKKQYFIVNKQCTLTKQQ